MDLFLLKRDFLFSFQIPKNNILKFFKQKTDEINKYRAANVIYKNKTTPENRFYEKTFPELRNLINVTRTTYQSCYLALLEHVANYFNHKYNPGDDDKKHCDKLKTSFNRVIAVLKFRRGYMLPIGANAETCYQQQDAWTLALFSAALVMDCGSDSIHLIPAATLARLKIFPTLYNQWDDFIKKKTESNNPFQMIIKQAEDALSNSPS